jgi:hypothetical protein
MTFRVSRQLILQRCHWPKVNRVSSKPVEYQVKVERLKSEGVTGTECKPIQIPQVCCSFFDLTWLAEALGVPISTTFVISNRGINTADEILLITSDSASISTLESVATRHITFFDLFADDTVRLPNLSKRFVSVTDKPQFEKLFPRLSRLSWVHPKVVHLRIDNGILLAHRSHYLGWEFQYWNRGLCLQVHRYRLICIVK